MTDRYEDIRKALDVIDECADGTLLMTRDRCARLRKAADTIRELLAERDSLAEGLSDTEKDVAVAQAVEFAEYVERQAKGTMRDAAKRFLSLPYSQEVAERLMERDALEKQAREFRRIGSLLANAAYNLAQHSALKGSTREALDNLRRQWDAAIAAANGGGNG